MTLKESKQRLTDFWKATRSDITRAYHRMIQLIDSLLLGDIIELRAERASLFLLLLISILILNLSLFILWTFTK